jgi:hypothetical protein
MNAKLTQYGAALLSAAAIGAFAGSAHAAVTVYNSQAGFDAAVPTAVTFGFHAGGSLQLDPNPLTKKTVTFVDDVTPLDIATGGSPLLFTVPHSATPAYGKDFLSYENTQTGILGEIESAGTLAIGFSYGSYVPIGPATLTLNTGDVFVINPDVPATFIGFTSTTPITDISITYPGGYAFDLVNVSVLGAVPEPSAWAMMLLGLGGLGAAMRSRGRSAAAV